MLKLERKSRNGIINVIFRDKDHLFTQPFSIAFLIALGIHLGLFIIFQVTPFKIGVSDTVFPPTRVQAETPSKESVLAEVIPMIQTIRGLPNMPASSPFIPEYPKFLTVRPVEYNKATGTKADAFMKIENEIYQPTFNPLVHFSKQPLKIVISGILAEQPIISDGLKDKEIEKLPFHLDERFVYHVLVEGTTGNIFWYEPQQASHNHSIDKFIESILKDMRFRINGQEIALSGEIELHFNLEAQ